MQTKARKSLFEGTSASLIVSRPRSAVPHPSPPHSCSILHLSPAITTPSPSPCPSPTLHPHCPFTHPLTLTRCPSPYPSPLTLAHTHPLSPSNLPHHHPVTLSPAHHPHPQPSPAIQLPLTLNSVRCSHHPLTSTSHSSHPSTSPPNHPSLNPHLPITYPSPSFTARMARLLQLLTLPISCPTLTLTAHPHPPRHTLPAHVHAPPLNTSTCQHTLYPSALTYALQYTLPSPSPAHHSTPHRSPAHHLPSPSPAPSPNPHPHLPITHTLPSPAASPTPSTAHLPISLPLLTCRMTPPAYLSHLPIDPNPPLTSALVPMAHSPSPCTCAHAPTHTPCTVVGAIMRSLVCWFQYRASSL
nr:vegetative cell wall protein gp1-like [Penaeus vannamei]